ncbi:DNA-directed RNA polymerase subunit beta', partial [Candidatus Sumerlaeota bacterium]|nr:DNA-directed RNA polymerase subunit beta' [Candidatus Sumerlaeota bacterium]
DMLKGKQGRFRQNLLGKRVDYSGRSVIVVGPELKFNQCGLPKKMALELFDPFIIRELQRREYCNTIKSAKKMMEREEPVVYDILDEIIADHPVLLNRAPTLHRLGVQAFMPKLVEGKAIRLHPLACAAFNADFDGDQMAVHVPLSVEAKMESKMLMLAENNILSPANGRPIATPSQDVVLGCYYLTKLRKGAPGEGMCFASPDEVELAHALGRVALHAEISVRVKGRTVRTTPGRVIFSRILPEEIDYYDPANDFCNELMTKKNLGAIVALAHKISGAVKTAQMLDDMKNLGFEFAKRGGVSIAVGHMIIPPTKADILGSAKLEVQQVEADYSNGVITNGERYNRVIDIWTHATDKVGAQLMQGLKTSHEGFNPIYMMAFSGARGSEQQIRQLAGMRGLMQKPTKKLTGGIGEIIESPIMSNFREGLTVVEYFISTHGARKGLADTALKTSDAGYLTRRLVDVAQDLIVNEDDCGTVNGIDVSAITEVTTKGARILESLSDRIEGRVSAEDIRHPHGGQIICERNQMIDERLALEIQDSGIETVKIRSVLTCETRRGVCVKCYGRNLSTGTMIELGEAVGVIAAQSIGEPGTQLTLRTFHIGGTASRQLEGWYEAKRDGTVKYKSGLRTVQRVDGDFIVINRTGKIVVEDDDGNEMQVLPTIPYGASIKVPDGGRVAGGDHFVEWQAHVTPIVAEIEGKVKFIDLKAGATLREEVDLATNQSQRIVTEHKEELHPQIQLVDDSGEILGTYALSSGTILSQGLANGKRVAPGEILARIPRARARSKDITGGLPRVDELFEARKPKDAAVIADIDGVVHFKGISKGVRKLAIIADNGEEHSFSIPLVRHLTVRDGERVSAGDQLTDGSVSPHDMLKVSGEKAVQEFLLAEIQEVYRLQGVNINDKHIECIIRQMLKKVIVTQPGDTHFLFGQQVDRAIFQEENQKVIEEGGQPATAEPKLLGLTKASLETESFISAASFQETTRVLTDAAIRGRCDFLRGLKENVIMGLLIPAGTGLPVNRNMHVEPILPHPPVSPTPSDGLLDDEEIEPAIG